MGKDQERWMKIKEKDWLDLVESIAKQDKKYKKLLVALNEMKEEIKWLREEMSRLSKRE